MLATLHQASLEHFEKRYKKLWDQDKDAYMRRYEKAQKPLSSFEADINEYISKQVRCLCSGCSVNRQCSQYWMMHIDLTTGVNHLL